jgi:hypothetical protein
MGGLVAAGLLALPGCFGDYGGSDGTAGATATGSPGGGSTSGSSGGAPGATTQESILAFSQTVEPLVDQYCVACHAGQGPGFPHIAHPDSATAHAAIVDTQKVNFANPANSRLVQRLVADFHHCWSDCVADGAAMTAAIVQWATLINYTAGGTNVAGGIQSESLALADGVEDDGSQRYTGHVIALWEFKEGSGTTVFDVSGVAPAMDLTISGDEVEWLSSYGLSFTSGKAQASRTASRKLFDRLADSVTGTQQYSVEAWVTPANTTQEGPARIVNYSAGTGSRNFGLGQVLYTYDFRNRNLATGISGNGTPSLQTYDGDQDLQATQQHVVLTYDPFRGRRIYVNGVWTEDEDEFEGSSLWNWSDTYNFVLANEVSNDRQWQGKIHLVAIYDEPLTEARIQQNFLAGVGRRFLLNFDLTPWIGPGSSLQFTVRDFDEYSYLFCEPTLTSSGSGFRLANMRVTVNGVIPVSGQAFVHVDTPVTQTKQKLSEQCSIIAKDLGPGQDVFAIEFAVLGGYQNIVVEAPPVVPPDLSVADPTPDEGVRDFLKVNTTMASLTGVDPTLASVESTFLELEQQLPSTHDLRSFVASHQVGIAKLSLEYCDQLVEDPALRQTFFGTGFNWNADAVAAFGGASQRDLILNPLVDRMLGTNLANQPTRAETRPLLDAMIDDLTAGCDPTSCPATRTRTVVKAACAAVLGSAAVTVH